MTADGVTFIANSLVPGFKGFKKPVVDKRSNSWVPQLGRKEKKCGRSRAFQRMSAGNGSQRKIITDNVYGSMFEAIGNTPLIKLRRASEESGCNVYGKAEFMNPVCAALFSRPVYSPFAFVLRRLTLTQDVICFLPTLYSGWLYQSPHRNVPHQRC